MKEDSERVPGLLTDYILKGELRGGFWAAARGFCVARVVLLMDGK